MARVGFEPMIPELERAKTVHALDRAATVIGATLYSSSNIVTEIWSRQIKWTYSVS
jgi:hypothetical protein